MYASLGGSRVLMFLTSIADEHMFVKWTIYHSEFWHGGLVVSSLRLCNLI